MSTDAKISGAMSNWTIKSLVDTCQVLGKEVAQKLKPKPVVLPNLQGNVEKQKELDQLRDRESRSRCVYSDAWQDT